MLFFVVVFLLNSSILRNGFSYLFGLNFFFNNLNFFFFLNLFFKSFLEMSIPIDTSSGFFVNLLNNTVSFSNSNLVRQTKVNSSFLNFFFFSYNNKVVTRVFVLGSTVSFDTTSCFLSISCLILFFFYYIYYGFAFNV